MFARSRLNAFLAILVVAVPASVEAQARQAAPAAAVQLPAGVTARDVTFYSEAVLCHARLFLPSGFSAASKAPAVVLAPGAGETAATLERFGARLAGQGIVAMAIDYRGWGKSGAFIYVADNVRWDDRLRFSNHTAKVRLRRKRIVPAAQVTDIRNAITWIQGEQGVDRARIGVWGADLGGGHAITTAGVDARVKAAVAHLPVIDGKDVQRRAWVPTAAEQSVLVKHARTGQAPATPVAGAAMNDEENKLALAEYQPFWYLEQIPPATSVLFVVAEKDTKVNNANHAIAASKVLKGTTNVVTLPGATHLLSPSAADTAATAAAEWFAKHL
jgi:dienelactone hydrolase